MDSAGTFTYDPDGHLTVGTITGWRYVTATSQFTVCGVNLSVAIFLTLLDTNDTDGFFAALFGGNDTMTGSALGDSLDGISGDERLMVGAAATGSPATSAMTT